jgi:hypothetical protein
MATMTIAVLFVALYAGHQLGDHVVQSNASAMAKGAPTADLLAAGVHPWHGWAACLRHVASYTAVQAVALLLVAPRDGYGIAAALAVSGSTHAVIDRRWLVRLLVRAKGCQGWAEGPYLIDQSLHTGALLVAAVVGAAVTAAGGVVAVAASAAGLIGAALLGEWRMSVAARLARSR